MRFEQMLVPRREIPWVSDNDAITRCYHENAEETLDSDGHSAI